MFNNKKKIKERIESHLHEINESLKDYDIHCKLLDDPNTASDVKKYVKVEKKLAENTMRYYLHEIKYELEKL